MFTFIELFAGIGGFRIAAERNGGQCVFACEIDKNCRSTYRSNFRERHVFLASNVKTFSQEPHWIKNHDLLTAGFPCQSFSSIGKRDGFKSEKGMLFFDLANIIDKCRPKAFLLENVVGLKTFEKGRNFNKVCDILKNQLGYQLHTKIICSLPWVPQHRKRIAFVGFREPNDFSFDQMEIPPEPYPTFSQIREHNPPEEFYIPENKFHEMTMELKKQEEAGYGFRRLNQVRKDGFTWCLRTGFYTNPVFYFIEDDGRPRYLTSRECSRLMGFDSFTGTDWIYPKSRLIARHQFGNAIVIPQFQEIIRVMRNYF